MTTLATATRAVGPPTDDTYPWWRQQTPAHSPVSLAALCAAAYAAISGSAADRAQTALLSLLTEQHPSRDIALTDSGTTALTAAIAGVVRNRPRAAVALPVFACYDVATAADGAGVPVVLYDINPHTLAPDMESVRAALRDGAAAIVLAHFYGYPVDLTEINTLAANAGAVVIEDAAQVAGATLHGRSVGGGAALGVLSLGRGKGWTGGGGGALLGCGDVGLPVVRDARARLGAAGRGIKELVALAAQFLLARPDVYAIPAALPFLRLGQTVYRAPRSLRRAPATACAASAATWPLVAEELAARRRNAEHLLVALRGATGFEAVRATPGARPGYLRLPVLTSPAVRRAAAQGRGTRLGISPAYPRALCDLDGFASRCVNRAAPFPGGRELAERLYTLPTHGRLSRRDVARVVSWIHSVGRE